MYAFATETIYAVLLKEKFGYGEVVMGLVLALNGVAVGVLQVSGGGGGIDAGGQ